MPPHVVDQPLESLRPGAEQPARALDPTHRAGELPRERVALEADRVLISLRDVARLAGVSYREAFRWKAAGLLVGCESPLFRDRRRVLYVRRRVVSLLETGSIHHGARLRP